jgi:hypothetical protein
MGMRMGMIVTKQCVALVVMVMAVIMGCRGMFLLGFVDDLVIVTGTTVVPIIVRMCMCPRHMNMVFAKHNCQNNIYDDTDSRNSRHQGPIDIIL